MSDEGPIAERLLTFEVDGGLYALPIRGVLEVAESSRVSAVPTLSRKSCGVMNWHADALPVISAEVLLQGAVAADDDTVEAAPLDAPGEDAEPDGRDAPDDSLLARRQVLVVSDRNEAAKLGLPIDGVLGLVDGGAPRARAADLVLERRSIDGRVVSVLDPRGLVGRAESVIQEMVT